MFHWVTCSFWNVMWLACRSEGACEHSPPCTVLGHWFRYPSQVKTLFLPPHFFWSYCLSGHCETAQFHLRGLVLNRSLILHTVLEVLIMDQWGWGPLWGGELSKALLQSLPTALRRQGRKLTMLSLHYQPKMLRRNTCATYHRTGTLPWTGSHCVHSQLEVNNLQLCCYMQKFKMYLALQCSIFWSIFWEYSAATCFNCVSHLFKSTILPHQTWVRVWGSTTNQFEWRKVSGDVQQP